MHILVTGAKGQLGQEIKALSFILPKSESLEFFFTDKTSSKGINTLNITDVVGLRSYIIDNKINVVVNCAAYTSVDKAEREKEKAELVNKTAPAYLAAISKELGVALVHLSTDFVFDGKKSDPYLESDSAIPVSVYGKTKLDGEHEIIRHGGTFVIIRTSWLYSEFGDNFVKTILRLAKEKKELRVVSDQIGTPTYARDLAKVILDIIPKVQEGTKEIFNYSNEGVASWYDFAKAIVDIKQLNCTVVPIETSEYPTPAKRPAYSVLDKTKIKKQFNVYIPLWQDSLEKCLQNL